MLGQANAEPDLQQTGNRLKGIIAGLVEGTLDLVTEPLEKSKSLCIKVCILIALEHWGRCPLPCIQSTSSLFLKLKRCPYFA